MTCMGSSPLTCFEPSLGPGVLFVQLLFICHTRARRAPEALLDAEVCLGGSSHLFSFTLPSASPLRE